MFPEIQSDMAYVSRLCQKYKKGAHLLAIMLFPYHVIDLTHTLHSHVPTWSGTCGFETQVVSDYHEGEDPVRFRVHHISSMSAGLGTHLDAPAHIQPGGKTIHDIPLSDLVWPCVVLDFSMQAHASFMVSLKDIKDWEQKQGLIPAKSCVMIRTGWDQWWSDPMRYRNHGRFPGVSQEAAEYFFNRDVSALGIDTLSPDGDDLTFPVHHLFLTHQRLLIENVAHLDHMPPIGSFVMACPLKLHCTEAPIRCVGLVHRTEVFEL